MRNTEPGLLGVAGTSESWDDAVGAGLESQKASVVATDGTVTDGPYPETKEVIGGFSVVDVHSREEALEWAAKIAFACRCVQEVREILPGSRLPTEGPPPL